MKSYKDYIGKTVGKLLIIKRVGTTKNRTPILECICTCGNVINVRANHIMHEHTTSCGCNQKEAVSKSCIVSLIGKKFSKLTVVSLNSRRTSRATYWNCLCDCGKTTVVFSRNLNSGNTKSCGCLKKDFANKVYNFTISPGYCREWKNKDLRMFLYLRDNSICQNPYCFNIKSRLVHHHIDYDKKHCSPKNLITICSSCNVRANKDRAWHTEWYQTLMNKKFGYNY